MKRIKYLLIPTIIVFLFTLVFATGVYAEEAEEKTLVEPEIVLSPDSVDDFVTYTISQDVFENKTVINLVAGTFGICIYDNAETDYIDGIRLNDETVTSTTFPIDLSKSNKITVRTTYKDDFTGKLAQIADGTFDYTELIKNPITLFMAAYYILAIISVLIGIVASLFGKKKKVKTSNEIAAAVDTRAKEACGEMKSDFIAEVSTVLEPFFKTMSSTQEAIIEAIVLMNSKDDNSHMQALECLKKVSSADVKGVISTVHTELAKVIQAKKTHKAQTLQNLTQIAETAQEVSANVNTPPVL
jgi:hypothetical protein